MQFVMYNVFEFVFIIVFPYDKNNYVNVPGSVLVGYVLQRSDGFLIDIRNVKFVVAF